MAYALEVNPVCLAFLAMEYTQPPLTLISKSQANSITILYCIADERMFVSYSAEAPRKATPIGHFLLKLIHPRYAVVFRAISVA